MKAIEAFYIQLTATIPLSWKFASAPFHQKFYHISLENIVIYSVFATLFCKAILRFDYSMINRKNLYKCMAFSLFAFTGPALAIALCSSTRTFRFWFWLCVYPSVYSIFWFSRLYNNATSIY